MTRDREINFFRWNITILLNSQNLWTIFSWEKNEYKSEEKS